MKTRRYQVTEEYIQYSTTYIILKSGKNNMTQGLGVHIYLVCSTTIKNDMEMIITTSKFKIVVG